MNLQKNLQDVKNIGLSDVVIANYIGVTTQTIRNIRNGENNILYSTGFKLEKLAAAARAFSAEAAKLNQ